jgi:predicted ATPase
VLAPLSPLVGRVAEREAVAQSLADGARLCTLVGPGGIGKTRVAHALCAALDGLFCDLSECRDESSALATIAAALDLRAVGAIDAATIERALRSRPPSLLVLDNVEQIVDAVASLARRWLAAVPALAIVATSRERLAIDAERAFVIEPLPTSDPMSDAAALFVERARAAGAAEISPEQAAAVARALEGVPLAIELAAARVKVLGIDALVHHSDGLLDLLRSARRDGPSRHETLRRTIDWSWGLLSELDRSAFAACSVFRGGFDAAAAEAVLGRAGSLAIDLVQNLVERSLVQARADALGRQRFYLFDTLRAYAAERAVQRGELASALARHRAHYVRLGARLVNDVERRPVASNLTRLELERDNLARIADDPDDPRDALRALVALDPIARLRGAVEAQERSLSRALSFVAETDEPDADALRARALRARGRARLHRGAVGDARADLDAALTRARFDRDEPLVAQLLVELGVLAHQQRALDEASDRYLQASALASSQRDESLLARIEANLAAVHHDRAEFADAERRYRAALDRASSLHEPRLEGITRSNLALLALERGSLDEADRLFDRASLLLDSSGDRRLFAINEGNRALFAHFVGRLRAARDGSERAATILASLGEARSEGLCRARLGGALADLGEFSLARVELARSEALLERAGDALGLEALALHRALLAIAEAPEAPSIRAALLVSVRASLAKVPRAGSATLSDDVRIAARIVEARLDALASGAGPKPLRATVTATLTDASTSGATLAVGPDAEWFRLDAGTVQDLRAHGPLRRVFVALVRAQAAGEWLEIDALLAAGWPGERVVASAANNRVHVALSDLRRRGLRPWLVQREGRYQLASELRVRDSLERFVEPVAQSHRGGRPRR